MKYIRTLIGIVITILGYSQINQQDSLLSTYLRNNFPYDSVVYNNCDSQYVGCFYVSFEITKKGGCSNLSFSGVDDTLIQKSFTAILSSPLLSFSKAFAKQTKGRKIVQPVFYSYFNCINIEIDTAKMNSSDSYIYTKALQMLSKQTKAMNKSINEGFLFNTATGFYDCIILKPCIIDINPRRRGIGNDLVQKKYTKEEIDAIEKRIKEIKKAKEKN